MKEVKDFKHIMNDLCSISDCPNFSDEMRDKASDLMFYIKCYKPAEPLIVRSGETWVAHWEGVDYLCVNPELYPDDRIKRPIDFSGCNWKSFTGPNPDITELDDTLAKLRPIVKAYGTTGKLIFVDGIDSAWVIEDESGNARIYSVHIWRLATAEELQEADK